MKIEEIIPALREGKKIRAIGWRKECFVQSCGGRFRDDLGVDFTFGFASVNAEWELAPEPAKHRVWVNLSAGGTVWTFGCAADAAKHRKRKYTKIIETREIEWEVK